MDLHLPFEQATFDITPERGKVNAESRKKKDIRITEAIKQNHLGYLYIIIEATWHRTIEPIHLK